MFRHVNKVDQEPTKKRKLSHQSEFVSYKDINQATKEEIIRFEISMASELNISYSALDSDLFRRYKEYLWVKSNRNPESLPQSSRSKRFQVY